MKKIIQLLIMSIFVIPLFVNALNSDTSVDQQAQIDQLRKENEQLKEENIKMQKKVSELEQKNNELSKLLEEQDKILTTMAKTKMFTQKIWDSFSTQIKELNKKVDERIKKIKEEETKDKKE